METMKRLAALLSLTLATTALAQNTDIEALSGLQFNFGNPGARSLGMGGAFIGLADDASAAESNPAGLTILRKSEVSMELRQSTISQRFVTGGTYPFVTDGDFPAQDLNVTFASVVVPFHAGVVAGYYHRPLSFSNQVDVTSRYTTPNFYLGPDGPVSAGQCGANCTEHRIYPFATSVDVAIETFGLAAARRWGDFSFGAAVRYHRFSEEADTFRQDLDAPGSPVFAVAQTNASRLFGKTSDNDLTFVAGVRWIPSSVFSAGAIVKKGPTFPVAVQAAPSTSATMQLVASTEFHVPSIIGVGVSYRPAPQLTINADAVRVGYGKLTDKFVSVLEYGTESAGAIESAAGYETKNGLELHAGVEYFILLRAPVGLRAGWWRDPAHSIAYRGPLTTPHGVAARILFPGTEAENHYSVGIGVSLPHFGVDVAYDTARSLRTASLSFIARR
jgi:long-subunit fatty acid transport protein